MTLDLHAIRRQFPYLTPASGKAPVYLDSAATSMRPRPVIDAVSTFMASAAGNVHRGQHASAESATDAYEQARRTVQTFTGAAHGDEIIFTKNATEGINLVMRAWALQNLQAGDCIVLTAAEHHANSVPWLQMLEAGMGIRLIWIDVLPDGSLDTELLDHVLETEPVRLLAVTGQSNVLGTRFALAESIRTAREKGARILIDAAQLAAHAPLNVLNPACDFLVFSGHKIYGPTGIGVLYASRDVQKEMSPFMGGGGMVQEVRRDGFTPADGPAMFEAGTPPITQAVGLAAAIDWQKQFSWQDRETHDRTLMIAAAEALGGIPGLTMLGGHDPAAKHGCISFTLEGVHPHDLTDILGQKGIALRAGHHCAQPLHEALGIVASTRLSTGLYTTEEEILIAAEAIKDAINLFR